MKQAHHATKRHRMRVAHIGGPVGLLLALGLLLAPPASASFEQAGNFATESGKRLLRDSIGMAVNTTGAGGVPAGTFYSVSRERARVVRFNAQGEFRAIWGWGVADGKTEFERCGPDGDAAYPTCGAEEGGGPEFGFGLPGEGLGQFNRTGGITVDQATGYVYVFNDRPEHAKNTILVFSADGSELIDSFGERGVDLSHEPPETIEDGPEKIHAAAGGALAVDEAGRVYVPDRPNGKEGRVMVFAPQTPGDYEHYVYTGRENDIASSHDKVDYFVSRLTVDSDGNLFTGSEENIYEFAKSEPDAPVCEYVIPGGAAGGMTIDPMRDEVYYFSSKDKKIHHLSACNGQGEFEQADVFALTPKSNDVRALAFNPTLSYEASRPAGLLYATSFTEHGLGYIFAPAEIHFPSVESESASAVTPTTASLEAQINPNGSVTNYAFQYIDQAAYEANDPNERQSLTVSATGGVFGLGFEGHSFGGAATADLSSGSATATSLRTAKGTATLKAAKGTATLKAGIGTGTTIAGSSVITAVTTTEGAFEVGQQVDISNLFNKAVPSGTTITAINAENPSTSEITISKAATESVAKAKLIAGSATLTAVTTTEGAFEVGQQIRGEHISNGATITAVKAGELTISKVVTAPATGVALQAGSDTLSAVTTSLGSFEVGQPIEGAGIPPATTIAAVEEGKLTLSNAVTTPGTGVAISSSGPAPLALGERVEGPGIPAGTTILAAEAGELTLSNPATASGTGVTLHAGLPFDAPAAKVRSALAALSTIGAGNIAVSGGPGDETGSSPYEIEFTGTLGDIDLPQVSADGSGPGLSGGSATATVQTANDGGNGFQGATEAPLGGAELGTGQEPLGAGTSLTGLQPDIGYHYRVVVTSHCNPDEEEKACVSAGADKAFHTSPLEASELPDHRAYELVSPAQKFGGEVFPAQPRAASCGLECKPGDVRDTYPMQSSLDGESVVYEGFPFSPTEGAVKFNEYHSKRTASGWQTTTLSAALQNTGGQGYQAFDAGLSQGLTYQTSPILSPEAPEGFANLYTQSTASPSSLTPLIMSESPNRKPQLIYAGASADFSRIFFEANDALTGEMPFAPEAVDGGAKENNLYESVGGELRLVNVLPGNTETVPGAVFGWAQPFVITQQQADVSHAISDDGSRVFWSDESGQVYVRENGESTTEIPDPGKFLTASADGSKVLLRNGHLYDLETEAITDLTGGNGGFQGIIGQSEDLSSVYFVDTVVLTGEEENDHGVEAKAGQNNLYVWNGGITTFIATLLPRDNDTVLGSPGGSGGDWFASPAQRSAEASPNGRWAAFLSTASLTGYDNNGRCVSGGCQEAYLYDSATGTLTCPSCKPSGLPPIGVSNLRIVSGAHGTLTQPRYLTDSGRLYFDSRDSLVPADTNNGVEDVYQYEPQGVGTCKRAGGCVNLISAGHEPIDSNFLSTDLEGKSVFFTTRDQLVLKDTDDLIDLYVAREDGGIASETETGRSECQGEACQAALVPPNDPTPGSSSFEGAGNVDEKKATKKHKKKKHKHAKKAHHNKRAHKRAANDNRGGAK